MKESQSCAVNSLASGTLIHGSDDVTRRFARFGHDVGEHLDYRFDRDADHESTWNLLRSSEAPILPWSREIRVQAAPAQRGPPRRGGRTMKSRTSSSWRTLCLALGLLAFVTGATSEAFANPDDSKIDRTLMARLTDEADAIAPFFVVFAERADLKP